MPSLNMKTKQNTVPLREKGCLGVCQKSSMISKVVSSNPTFPCKTSEFDELVPRSQDAKDIYSPAVNSNEDSDNREYLTDNSQFPKQSPVFFDSNTMGRMESMFACPSALETIFFPALEPVETLFLSNINYNLGPEDSDQSSCDYLSCNIPDFFISDMIIANIPFDGTQMDDHINEINSFPDYKSAESTMLFNGAEQCLFLPCLEDTVKESNSCDLTSSEECIIDPNSASLYFAISQIKSCKADLDQVEYFDPQLFKKNLPELSDLESSCHHNTPPKQSLTTKSITLALDLDETLVHSTLDHCDDADFTFNVFYNLKEHTVYVKQRPHLHEFLERVAEMFKVVIFTASQRIYAAQLLDILDPDQKLISGRVYRESCIFTDGSYTKDLTVLGVDLAKVAIVDNSPQVFRLQVNNGIPIKSWFNDPLDCALISLLPFLETLVDADDVRPIIAKTFGNPK